MAFVTAESLSKVLIIFSSCSSEKDLKPHASSCCHSLPASLRTWLNCRPESCLAYPCIKNLRISQSLPASRSAWLSCLSERCCPEINRPSQQLPIVFGGTQDELNLLFGKRHMPVIAIAIETYFMADMVDREDGYLAITIKRLILQPHAGCASVLVALNKIFCPIFHC